LSSGYGAAAETIVVVVAAGDASVHIAVVLTKCMPSGPASDSAAAAADDIAGFASAFAFDVDAAAAENEQAPTRHSYSRQA